MLSDLMKKCSRIAEIKWTLIPELGRLIEKKSFYVEGPIYFNRINFLNFILHFHNVKFVT